VTSAGGFGPTDVFCAKAKRQQQDVGHSVLAIGRGVLRLSSTISASVFCTESVATGTGVGHPLKSNLNPHSPHHL